MGGYVTASGVIVGLLVGCKTVVIAPVVVAPKTGVVVGQVPHQYSVSVSV